MIVYSGNVKTPHSLGKAKVRQILNQNPDTFAPVERGVWSLAA